jgi:hypothetical protein
MMADDDYLPFNGVFRLDYADYVVSYNFPKQSVERIQVKDKLRNEVCCPHNHGN